MADQLPKHEVLRNALGLITEQELADTLGLTSITTLATWRGQRQGPPYVKLGKRVFYTLALVSQWMNECYANQKDARDTAVNQAVLDARKAAA